MLRKKERKNHEHLFRSADDAGAWRTTEEQVQAACCETLIGLRALNEGHGGSVKGQQWVFETLNQGKVDGNVFDSTSRTTWQVPSCVNVSKNLPLHL